MRSQSCDYLSASAEQTEVVTPDSKLTFKRMIKWSTQEWTCLEDFDRHQISSGTLSLRLQIEHVFLFWTLAPSTFFPLGSCASCFSTPPLQFSFPKTSRCFDRYNDANYLDDANYLSYLRAIILNGVEGRSEGSWITLETYVEHKLGSSGW